MGRRLDIQILEQSHRAAFDGCIRCQEQLLPPYRGLEIGMAEKLITKAIARAVAQEEKAVMAQYKRLGDLGLMAKALLRKPTPDLLHAFELRDQSWMGEEVFVLLEERGVSFCTHDLPGLVTPLCYPEGRIVSQPRLCGTVCDRLVPAGST